MKTILCRFGIPTQILLSKHHCGASSSLGCRENDTRRHDSKTRAKMPSRDSLGALVVFFILPFVMAQFRFKRTPHDDTHDHYFHIIAIDQVKPQTLAVMKQPSSSSSFTARDADGARFRMPSNVGGTKKIARNFIKNGKRRSLKLDIHLPAPWRCHGIPISKTPYQRQLVTEAEEEWVQELREDPAECSRYGCN
jgi:hypothetical protein